MLEYLAWPAVYFSGKSGIWVVRLWKSPSTKSCAVHVSPYVWITGSAPAALPSLLLEPRLPAAQPLSVSEAAVAATTAICRLVKFVIEASRLA